jgi:RHS repeat-associated core domain
VGRIAGTDRTTYLYGDPRDRFRVTAVRAPGGELTTFEYDENGLLLAMRRGGTRYFVATDHLGTPRRVLSTDGATEHKRLTFDTWGNLVEDTAPDFDLPIGFAGGLPDPLTGLVRFGLRDYDPATGRWTSRDPKLFAGGQMNLYAYAGNAPASLRDPSGLDWSWEGVKETAGQVLDAIENYGSEVAPEASELAGTGNEIIGHAETAVEVVETAYEIDEALDKTSEPEQAAGIFKACIKWIDKVLPVNLTPTELVEETMDRGRRTTPATPAGPGRSTTASSASWPRSG